MFSVVVFFIVLRYILVFFENNTLFFTLTLTLFLVIIEYLKRFTTFKTLLDRVDSALFNTYFIQGLLQLTVQFESSLKDPNFFRVCLGYFMYMFALKSSFYGLVFIASSKSSISFFEAIDVFVLLWSSFYVRLRLTSLNYFNLEIDTPTVSWDNLLTRFQEKQNLSLVSKLPSQQSVALVSMRHSSYLYLKTAIHDLRAKRGMREGAKAAAKIAKKVTTENSSNASAIVGGVVTAGIGLYGIHETVKVQNETNAVQRQTNATTDKATEAVRESNEIRRAELAEFKRKNDLEEQQKSSGSASEILDAHRDKDGNLKLRQPGDSQTPDSVSVEKQGPKDMSFIEGESSSVVRLDGSRVEDFFSFFI